MDGYQRRTEKKKEQIRNSAFELFSIYGVEKVSIAEIAKKAKVSPVTIYNYFGSKEDLLKEVLSDFMNKELESYQELLNSDLPFPKKVEKTIFEKREAAKAFNAEFLKSITDPFLKEFINDFTNNKAIPMLMDLIEQGRKEGYVNKSISTEAIIIYIHTFSESIQRSELLTNYNIDILLDLTNLFFYGLQGQSMEKEA